MADNNNQDMSMEDILSSIKDILADDAQTQKSDKQSAPVISHFVEDTEKKSSFSISDNPQEDDIIDLSPSMRIDSPFVSVDVPGFEQELEDIKPLPFDDEDSEPLSLDDMLDGSDHLYLDSEQTKDTFLSDKELMLDSDSDPFYEENVATPNYDEVIEPATFAAEIAPSYEVAENAAKIKEPDFVPEISYVSEPEIEYYPEPEVQSPSNNAVDVSANIISNFAKMFAQDSAAKPVAVSAPSALPNVEVAPLYLGDSFKTIQDVVSDVIQQIIGAEVSANWRKNADYELLATQEIKNQTQNWLDANLPTLVERIVKQEIERVMAKVGNNQ